MIRNVQPIIHTLGAAAFALLLPSLATAQGAQQACASDIQSHCAGVAQGEGRIAKCLAANEQKLTPGCKAGMAKTADLMKEVVQACEDDIHKFCSTAAKGTVKECLRTNFRELSMGCKRELFEAKKGGM